MSDAPLIFATLYTHISCKCIHQDLCIRQKIDTHTHVTNIACVDEHTQRSCRSFFAKEPLIIGLFCGKWAMKIKNIAIVDEHTQRNLLAISAAYSQVATHCNTPQHVETHCNTLRYTATHCNTPLGHFSAVLASCLAHLCWEGSAHVRTYIFWSKYLTRESCQNSMRLIIFNTENSNLY